MAQSKKITLKILLALLLSILIAAVIFIVAIFSPIPVLGFEKLDSSKFVNVNKAITVLGSDGEIIGDKICQGNKIYVPLDKLPEYVLNSFIAIEDKRFYKHNGVDFYRILGAMKNNITTMSFREGASTITQQLIKNTHLSSQKTIKRKINEIKLAYSLEKSFSKDKILEMYLNVLYFGNNVYGIGSAARAYFGKSADNLTLSESATLAGIINNPKAYDLYENYDNAITRRNLVLKRMLSQDMISQNEYECAKNESLCVNNIENYKNQFVLSVINEAKNALKLSGKQLFSENFTIYTRYDSKIQKQLENALENRVYGNLIANACVCENTHGFVIAKAGIGNEDFSNFKRSPGSTIKPFLCYAPALEKKLIYPASPILDEPVNFSGYSPKNFDKAYHGWISCEESIYRSFNVPAVKMLNMSGINYSVNLAKKFGFELTSKDNSLAIALGATQNGFTIEQIAQAYSALSRRGLFTPASYISSVYNKNHECAFVAEKSISRAVSEDTACLVNVSLNKCAKIGTAKRLKKTAANVCAKTGTVGNKDGNTDAYCIAYTPNYTVAIWIGCKSGHMNNEVSGGTIPCSIAYDVINALQDKTPITMSDRVQKIAINSQEYSKNQRILIANSLLPDKDRIEFYFSKSNIPYAFCEDVRYSKLDKFDNFKVVDSLLD